MNKSAIAVRGAGNTGKTKTIRKTVDLLLKAYPNHTLQKIHNEADITYILEINDVKIGIESQGDPNSRIFDSLPKFVAEGCSIILCACRTRGQTVQAVEDLHRNHQYEIIWKANHYSREKKDQDQLNQISASGILKLIKGIMNEKL